MTQNRTSIPRAISHFDKETDTWRLWHHDSHGLLELGREDGQYFWKIAEAIRDPSKFSYDGLTKYFGSMRGERLPQEEALRLRATHDSSWRLRPDLRAWLLEKYNDGFLQAGEWGGVEGEFPPTDSTGSTYSVQITPGGKFTLGVQFSAPSTDKPPLSGHDYILDPYQPVDMRRLRVVDDADRWHLPIDGSIADHVLSLMAVIDLRAAA